MTKLITPDIRGVQPMTGPTGVIFSLRYNFLTDQSKESSSVVLNDKRRSKLSKSVLKRLKDFKIVYRPADQYRETPLFDVKIGGSPVSSHCSYKEAAEVVVKHAIDPWYYERQFIIRKD